MNVYIMDQAGQIYSTDSSSKALLYDAALNANDGVSVLNGQIVA